MKNTYSIFRTNISPYQGKLFFNKEKKALESIKNVEYVSDIKEAKTKTILITNTHTTTKELQKTISQNDVRLIIHPNSGYDNFTSSFVKNCKIPIIAGNSVRAQAVANYIITATLTHFSKVPHHKRWNKERKWNRSLLCEKNILIIGHGHIGRILEKTFRPLAKKIFIYDPYQDKEQLPIEKSDIVLLAASLNKTSRKIVNKNFLKKLPEEFLLVNAARGELIDQSELITTLKDRPSSFAYLDVFEQEPFKDDSFKKLKNLVTSSHIAGVYSNLNDEIITFEKKVISDFIKMENQKFQNKYQNMLLNNRLRDGHLI